MALAGAIASYWIGKSRFRNRNRPQDRAKGEDPDSNGEDNERCTTLVIP